MRQGVANLLPAAQACNLNSAGQCGKTVAGECCPVSVDNPNAQAVVAYENALTIYKNACTPVCPPVLCVVTPSNTCMTTGECR
jgi:hypothetical protein